MRAYPAAVLLLVGPGTTLSDLAGQYRDRDRRRGQACQPEGSLQRSTGQLAGSSWQGLNAHSYVARFRLYGLFSQWLTSPAQHFCLVNILAVMLRATLRQDAARAGRVAAGSGPAAIRGVARGARRPSGRRCPVPREPRRYALGPSHGQLRLRPPATGGGRAPRAGCAVPAPPAGPAAPFRVADYSELATQGGRNRGGCNLKLGIITSC